MALAVVDRAIQSFGAEGVSQDTELASKWAGLRTLRIADVRLSVHISFCLSQFFYRVLMPFVSFAILAIIR